MGVWFRWRKEIYEGRRIGGQTTERTTALTTGVTYSLFTITGGRILVTQILGEITAVVAGALTISLQAVPTAALATTRAMCAGLLVTAYDVGDLLGITGVNTDAMLPPAASGVVEGQTFGVIVQPGAIQLLNNIADATASIRWTLKWIPFDSGAAVAAA